MPLLILLIIASLTLEATAASTSIDTAVKGTDEQGNITFTDQPKANSGVTGWYPVPVVNLMRAPVPPKPDDNKAESYLAADIGSAATTS